jgi:hypothetical protein
MPGEYFLQLIGPRAAPADRPWESGLPLENGGTAPFVVDRGWVGPAGTYIEEWSIRRGDEVLYRHPASYIEVRGLQAVRRFTDTVRTPLALEPGDYDIVLVVEGYRMGSFTVEARPLRATSEAPPAPARPEPAPAPAAAPAATHTGEDPAAVRKRVYEEELAKGSDQRVAEARAKSAEIKAKKAAAAPAAPAAAPSPKPAAARAPERPPAPLPPPAAEVPPGGGGFTPEEAAVVRRMIFDEATARGEPEEVAEALAGAAEVRARRGPWWRPDW